VVVPAGILSHPRRGRNDLPEIERMFPHLGELRAELAAIVGAGTTEPRELSDGSSPADHAARLLAYWADPADDVLVVQYRGCGASAEVPPLPVRDP